VKNLYSKRTGRSVIDKFWRKKNGLLVGTMMEIRACLTANEIGEVAEFFSFGTMISPKWALDTRDDAGKFLPILLKRHFKSGSVSVLDQEGIGRLIGTTKGEQ
jgi:pyruvate,orthophosphate dikinase